MAFLSVVDGDGAPLAGGAEPGLGAVVGVMTRVPSPGRGPLRRRPGAHKAQVRGAQVERLERLRDRGIRDVPHKGDMEMISAELLSRRPRLNPRHIHPAHRELLQRRHQGARLIRQAEYDGRAVIARRLRHRSPRPDERKTGPRSGMIGHPLRDDLQPVKRGRNQWSGCGVGSALRNLDGGGGVGTRRHELRPRHVLRQPPLDLLERHGVGGDAADLRGIGAGAHHDGERNVQIHLPVNLHPLPAAERVEGGRDRPVHRVLYRHAGVVRFPGAHEIDGRRRACDGQAAGVGGVELVAE